MSEIRITDRGSVFLPAEASKKKNSCFISDCISRFFAALAAWFKLIFCCKTTSSLKSKISYSSSAPDSAKPVKKVKSKVLPPSTPKNSTFSFIPPTGFYPTKPLSSKTFSKAQQKDSPLIPPPEGNFKYTPISSEKGSPQAYKQEIMNNLNSAIEEISGATSLDIIKGYIAQMTIDDLETPTMRGAFGVIPLKRAFLSLDEYLQQNTTDPSIVKHKIAILELLSNASRGDTVFLPHSFNNLLSLLKLAKDDDLDKIFSIIQNLISKNKNEEQFIFTNNFLIKKLFAEKQTLDNMHPVSSLLKTCLEVKIEQKTVVTGIINIIGIDFLALSDYPSLWNSAYNLLGLYSHKKMPPYQHPEIGAYLLNRALDYIEATFTAEQNVLANRVVSDYIRHGADASKSVVTVAPPFEKSPLLLARELSQSSAIKLVFAEIVDLITKGK